MGTWFARQQVQRAVLGVEPGRPNADAPRKTCVEASGSPCAQKSLACPRGTTLLEINSGKALTCHQAVIT